MITGFSTITPSTELSNRFPSVRNYNRELPVTSLGLEFERLNRYS
jgi:hypothetical protein